MSNTRETPFQIIPDGEADERRAVAQMTVQLQKKRKAVPSNNDEILRGVHPKSHGCVDANFIVNKDISRELRVGIFSEPGKSFKAKIRYSNADVLILPDVMDGVNRSRGMAIKIMDAGEKALDPDIDGSVNQDFLLINTPGFAFGTVRSYARLTRALLLDEFGASADLFFLPLRLAELGLLNPATASLTPPAADEPAELAKLRGAFMHSGIFDDFGPADFAETVRSFQVVQTIQAQTVRNPIEVPYFSASTFRFGGGQAMRLAIRPEDDVPDQKPFSDNELAALSPDFLAEALKKTLTKKKKVVLKVEIQVAKRAELEGRVAEMVEDATRSWDEAEFPPHEVARLVVPGVAPEADLVDACKGQFFTPWHTLAVHRPLGGINRLRRPVYTRSAKARMR